jgi:hypothetical protein
MSLSLLLSLSQSGLASPDRLISLLTRFAASTNRFIVFLENFSFFFVL